VTALVIQLLDDTIVAVADRGALRGWSGELPILGEDTTKITVRGTQSLIGLAGQISVPDNNGDTRDIADALRATPSETSHDVAVAHIENTFATHAQDFRRHVPSGADATDLNLPAISIAAIASIEDGQPRLTLCGLTEDGPVERQHVRRGRIVLAPLEVIPNLETACDHAIQTTDPWAAAQVIAEAISDSAARFPGHISPSTDAFLIRPGASPEHRSINPPPLAIPKGI
jgi:hypothetical protein